MLNGLDLFSGIGGITKALAEWVRPVAYCENNRFAISVLLSRMVSGDIPTAPIWDDIKTLETRGLPKIDIIYGGFPCQDISISNTNGKGLGGEQSGLFYEITKIIDGLEPPFVFMENVPAISFRGLGEVTREFTKRGYDLRWTTLSAYEVGAPHIRKRWWCLAYAASFDGWFSKVKRDIEEKANIGNNGKKESLADSPASQLHEARERHNQEWGSAKRFADHGWWSVEPDVGRVVNGLPMRVDRIKSLGNSVVPQQAKTAFKYLMGLTSPLLLKHIGGQNE